MDYDHVILRTGEAVEAAGVAVIAIGAVINTGAAAVRLAHHETGTYRRFRQQLGPPRPAPARISRVATLPRRDG